MKERVISRTIESTKATIVKFNKAENKLFDDEKIFSGKMSLDDAFKAARKEETSEYPVVMIKSVELTSKLYGMKENDFIQHGFILDERTAKVDGEKIITRSITASVVTFKAFDTSKMEMITKREYFSGKPTTDDALKTLRTMETDTMKVVMVEGIETVTNLYAIKESTFLEYAYELPPRMAQNEDENEEG